MTQAEIDQLIEDTKQHYKDGLITRIEAFRKLRKLLELKAERA